MKKTVVIILALLPIVLLLIIAFAGRILSTYQRIDVERVVFTDDNGKALANEAVITISTGETVSTRIQIYPELATDKRVSYSSSNERVCTVDKDGAVTGISAGSATIVVKTADGNKTAQLTVIVRADGVTGVTLTPETLSMMIGESYDLRTEVVPNAALNKKVTYETSDPSVVTVGATGKVKAVGAGTAIVTVTTSDGGFTDTCTVTVTDSTPPLFFDFTSVAGMQQTGVGYISSTDAVDLFSGLEFIEEIEKGDILFRVVGGGAAVDENGVLTFNQSGMVNVIAYVGDADDPTYSAEVRIAWLG